VGVREENFESSSGKIIPSGDTSLTGAGNTDTTEITKLAELLLDILLGDLVFKVSDVQDLRWGAVVLALLPRRPLLVVVAYSLVRILSSVAGGLALGRVKAGLEQRLKSAEFCEALWPGMAGQSQCGGGATGTTAGCRCETAKGKPAIAKISQSVQKRVQNCNGGAYMVRGLVDGQVDGRRVLWKRSVENLKLGKVGEVSWGQL